MTQHYYSKSVPVVEVSKDNGLTWSMFNYWRSTQETKANECCARLARLYPEWKARVAWTFITEDTQLASASAGPFHSDVNAVDPYNRL